MLSPDRPVVAAWMTLTASPKPRPIARSGMRAVRLDLSLRLTRSSRGQTERAVANLPPGPPRSGTTQHRPVVLLLVCKLSRIKSSAVLKNINLATSISIGGKYLLYAHILTHTRVIHINTHRFKS